MLFSKVPLWKGQVEELIHHDAVHWVGPACTSLDSTTQLNLLLEGGGGVGCWGAMSWCDSGSSVL